jgi:phage terminase large subunit-like protein
LGFGRPLKGWNFACLDWEDRLAAGRSLLPDLPLDEAEAARAAKIFDMLRLPDVPGQPRLKEAAGEWQRDIVRAIFGSLVDGARMVPEVFAMLPKKNSKTTGGAAITLTGLLMNVRPRAEFIYVGPTQEVADLAFQQTVGMIEADDYLTKRFHVAHHTKTITDRRNKARLKVKTFDMKVVTGSKPAFVLLDELHLMSTINGAGRVIGQIRGGLIPNPEAVLIIITTQSDQPPAGAFKTELQYARGVRDGRILNGRTLPILYEFPETMQREGAWRDPKNWPMVLPNLGKSITVERLIAEYAGAVEKGDEEERRWASQHLNVEIGIALYGDRWPGVDYWDTASEPGLTLESLLARCEVATIGIDGGGLDDLLGLAVIGREKETRRWLLWSRAWAHPIVLKRRKEIAETLRDFAKDGDLIFCERPTQDIEEVVAICSEVRDAGLLPEREGIGADKLGLPALVDELIAAGFDTDANGGTITGIGQGGFLNDAIIGTERKLADGTMVHAGQPLMRWAVENAKVELKGSARAITKQAAGKAKIDPMIAMLNAAKLMSRNPEAKRDPEFQMLVFG